MFLESSFAPFSGGDIKAHLSCNNEERNKAAPREESVERVGAVDECETGLSYFT
jgi:hypothetical protein